MRRHTRIHRVHCQDLLGRLVAKHVGETLIDKHGFALLIDQDALNRALDQVTKTLLAFPQGLFCALALGDVEVGQHATAIW